MRPNAGYQRRRDATTLVPRLEAILKLLRRAARRTRRLRLVLGVLARHSSSSEEAPWAHGASFFGTLQMDNAKNGLRGLRAVPSPHLLEMLRERYRLDERIEPRDLGGSSNLNLLIAAGGRRCVARVYRPYVTVSRV